MEQPNKKMRIIENWLIILCPFMIGMLVPALASIWICETMHIDFKTDGGIIGLVCYIFYVIVWTWIFKKLLKYSPWS